MNGPMSSSLVEIMDTLEDFRVDRIRLHNLTDILTLSVPGHLRGRQLRGHHALRPAQRGVAEHHPGLPNEIPSHDTPKRVFASCSHH